MKTAPRARLKALGDEPRRARLAIYGAVQGVGFRPFIYRLAKELGLAGWVNNSSQGVIVEVEGGRAGVEKFVTDRNREAAAQLHPEPGNIVARRGRIHGI